MSVLTIAAALALDSVLGEPRRAHPLVGFGRIAQALERRLHPGGAAAPRQAFLRGALAWSLAVLPLTASAVAAVRSLPQPAGTLFEVAVLYLAIGHRSLREHARQVASALLAGDLAGARGAVARIVSRDTADMDEPRVAAATVESVLENGNDALFAPLFWFALAGAPGAVLYRLANTLDAMWGYRSARYLHFGRCAARADDLLNYLPARLAALSYALCGTLRLALACWRAQAPAWDSPNAGPVMAAGAGSLRLRLGGGAFYRGVWHERPALGIGATPGARDIARACRLVLPALLLWIAALAALELAHA